MSNNLTLTKFETVYDLYRGIVYGISSAMLKTKKDAVAVTKEVFTEIIYEDGSLKNSEIAIILFKNAINKCSAILDGEVTPTDWTAVWDKKNEEKEESVSGIAEDELLKLFPQITQFDVKQREVLVLSSAGLNPQTISDIMGVPLQTVVWMQSQNKKELKDAGISSYSKYLKEVKETLEANEPSLKLGIADEKSEEFAEEDKKRIPIKPILYAAAAVAVIVAAVVIIVLQK